MLLSTLIICDYPDNQIKARYEVSDEKLSEYKDQIAKIMEMTFLDPEVQRVINTIDSISLH